MLTIEYVLIALIFCMWICILLSLCRAFEIHETNLKLEDEFDQELFETRLKKEGADE